MKKSNIVFAFVGLFVLAVFFIAVTASAYYAVEYFRPTPAITPTTIVIGTATQRPTVTPFPASTFTPTADAENEYYRGLFDACSYFGAQAGYEYAEVLPMCLEIVDGARIGNWYELPSQGYEP